MRKKLSKALANFILVVLLLGILALPIVSAMLLRVTRYTEEVLSVHDVQLSH